MYKDVYHEQQAEVVELYKILSEFVPSDIGFLYY